MPLDLENPQKTIQNFSNWCPAYHNLAARELIEWIIKRDEAHLSSAGALIVHPSKHTGRAAQDKFIVFDANTEKTIWWQNNQPMQKTAFNTLVKDLLDYVQSEQKPYFVQDLFVPIADEQFTVRFITQLAWHSLFMRYLLRPMANAHLADFTVINCPAYKADPSKHGCRSSTVIALDFTQKLAVICGTHYGGENKKTIFTVMNYIMPSKDILPMHCSVNHTINDADDSTIFFGLSGTGKTTLSSAPNRLLIGDDEHGWADTGIFNIENGCYAKTFNLSEQEEPVIYNAVNQFGSILENTMCDADHHQPVFNDCSITKNMRSAYPLSVVSSASAQEQCGHAKNIVMLVCDALGVFPPVAKLTIEQAIYHFLSGFTSKLSGTEQGVDVPVITFSTCFGAPFIPLHPKVYADMLKQKIEKTHAACWLVNTGWIGGGYKTGRRMPIDVTRKIIDSILCGDLKHCPYKQDDYFAFQVPTCVPKIDVSLLNPIQQWQNPNDFRAEAEGLKTMFVENFKQFNTSV